MVRFLRQFLSGEKGQALPIVLCLLAIGGLTIAVSLNYATTSLKGSGIVEEGTKGIYAAGAGVEYALWSLKNGDMPPEQLSENVSQMTVSVNTDNRGDFTVYLGDLFHTEPPQNHPDWVMVAGSITEIGGGVYEYTITVTWNGQDGGPQATNIKLKAVGARLPFGYYYQEDSAFPFEENLSRDEPTSNTTDVHGAYMVSWELGEPRPEVSEDDPEKTQTFYIFGTGSTEEHYACVEGQPESVGQVGEIKGGLWRITATATRPEDGKTTAKIVADVMIQAGVITVFSWQITE